MSCAISAGVVLMEAAGSGAMDPPTGSSDFSEPSALALGAVRPTGLPVPLPLCQSLPIRESLAP